MQTKGFTLIEMIFVLCIVGILIVMSPTYTNISKYILKNQMYVIKEILLQEQWTALQKKEERLIVIQHNKIQYNDMIYSFPQGVTCNNYQITFNGLGNIKQGGSFECHYQKNTSTIVMLLGNGKFYVK